MQKGQGHDHPEDLEGDMRHRHPARIRRGAQACRQRRRARTDIGPENHENGAVQGQESLLGEREHETDSGHGRGHARTEDRPHEKPQAGIARQGHQHLAGQRTVRDRRHRLRHDAHAQEYEAESQHHLSQALDEAATSEEREGKARAHEEKGQLLDLESEKLHGEGRADVGAQDDAERLAEGHEAGRHEADQHQRGGGRGLDEGGDEGPRTHGGQAIAGHAREQVTEMAARGALEPFPAELHAVEQQRQSAEETEEDHG